MPEENRGHDDMRGCGCMPFGGIFGGNNNGCCDNGILFFIIVFLLLFTNCGCCGRN